MNSNKIFSLSSALILENMKRYWYVPALSFLIYFMSGIFPILISKDNLNYLGSFVDHSLCNWSVPVSYTHLDVYKRQEQKAAGCSNGACPIGKLMRKISFCRRT